MKFLQKFMMNSCTIYLYLGSLVRQREQSSVPRWVASS